MSFKIFYKAATCGTDLELSCPCAPAVELDGSVPDGPHGLRQIVFGLLEKFASGRVAIAHAGPGDVKDCSMGADRSAPCAAAATRENALTPVLVLSTAPAQSHSDSALSQNVWKRRRHHRRECRPRSNNALCRPKTGNPGWRIADRDRLLHEILAEPAGQGRQARRPGEALNVTSMFLRPRTFWTGSATDRASCD
jgi:hypothetical protein